MTHIAAVPQHQSHVQHGDGEGFARACAGLDQVCATQGQRQWVQAGHGVRFVRGVTHVPSLETPTLSRKGAYSVWHHRVNSPFDHKSLKVG